MLQGMGGNGMEEQGGGDGAVLSMSLHNFDFWHHVNVSHLQDKEIKSRMRERSSFAHIAKLVRNKTSKELPPLTYKGKHEK